jgi:O-methyltransferase involved in polyketide biosynthesis
MNKSLPHDEVHYNLPLTTLRHWPRSLQRSTILYPARDLDGPHTMSVSSPSNNEEGSVINSTHKVHLSREKATLLITLYAKALDHRSRHPVLDDEKADEMVRTIDYDFEKLSSFGNGNIMVVRAKQFDEWLREFLSSNPSAVVLNLGCGLDTRVSRIKPPTSVSWFDIDYPEVIAERRKFYSERKGYRMTASSLTEPGWLEEVPRDRPAMIIADGVFEYLAPDEVKALLNRLIGHFPRGQIVFDVMSSFAVNSERSNLQETTGAVHQWTVDDVRTVDGMDPQLKRIDDVSVFRSRYVRKLPVKYRLVYGTMSVFSTFRNMMRLLRYEF